MTILNPDQVSQGGGGFPSGPPDNIFGTNSGTSLSDVTIAADITTAEATRDAYDLANTGWKDSYLDKDVNIILYYVESGDRYIQYQRNVGGTWTNNQSPVIAIKGPAGASGNSYFFPSPSDRDTFFNTPGNEQLLETNLPILVNRGSVATPYYWTGVTEPPSYDSTLFHPSLAGENAYHILDASDLEKVSGYSGGVITVGDGVNLTLILTHSFITTNVEFILEGSAELRITSNLADAVWNYTGTGTFVSGEGVRFSLNNVVLFSSSSPSTFIDTKLCTLNLNESAVAFFNILGEMVGTGLSQFGSTTSFISGFDTGLKLTNMVASVNSLVVTSGTLVGDALIIKSAGPFPLISTFTNMGTLLGPNNNLFNIDPVAANNVSVQISSVNTAGEEGLFNISGGSTGTFTSVVDDSISIGIDSVEDDGTGKARFNLSTSPDTVYVGEIVTISGYTTNTDYNGTFIVESIPVAGSFVVDEDFGSDESGGQVDANVVTLTDTGTTLLDGDTLTINTDDNLDYDGGATVFNQQTNTFQINRLFTVDATGTWDTSPIDQKAPNVLARDNPGFMDSVVKTEVTTFNNSAVTNIPVVGARVLINSTGLSAETPERLKLTSDGAVLYNGLEPVTIKCDGNLLLRPTSGNNRLLNCQFVRQDSERISCSFNLGNDSVVTTTPHGFSVDDNLTFNDTLGTLDTSLRSDIVYYVESIVSPTEFTVSYTQGGALITLSGGSSGSNSFAKADLHGSIPVEPIESGRPRTIVPQAIEDIKRGDKTFLVVSNTSTTDNIVVIDKYYRVVV